MFMGLGLIVGIGVFVSIVIVISIVGLFVIIVVVIVGFVVICNVFNSGQLVVNYFVSGGIYEYGYKYLNYWLGFIVGWMFLFVKSVFVVIVVLGFVGYLFNVFGVNN